MAKTRIYVHWIKKDSTTTPTWWGVGRPETMSNSIEEYLNWLDKKKDTSFRTHDLLIYEEEYEEEY